MKNIILNTIKKNAAQKKKMLAVLLDPENCANVFLENVCDIFTNYAPDFIFVGGSHTTSNIDKLIDRIKSVTKTPVVLFPGNVTQFSDKADAILFLSLLSGRNPEYLIGQHIYSSLFIKNSGIEVIPTAYLLIDGGRISSVEYISNTRPIPYEKDSIALSTAVAGELLGMQLVYLEAGSGAKQPVSEKMIDTVMKGIDVPLIVGGGIKNTDELLTAYNAGADLVVVGNIFEKEPQKIREFIKQVQELNRVL